MKKEDFLFIDKTEFFSALKINDNVSFEYVDTGVMRYVLLTDVLEDPDHATHFLKKFPALVGKLYTPGSRQYLNPMEISPLVEYYANFCNDEFKPNKFDPSSFLTASIITNKEDKVWNNSWIPHFDYSAFAINLYLNDYNGGTGLYKYRGVGDYNTFCKAYPDISYYDDIRKENVNDLVEWKKFDGDDDWELYHVIPSNKNTVAIMDTNYFHSTYTELQDEYRYSLISFYYSDRKFN